VRKILIVLVLLSFITVFAQSNNVDSPNVYYVNVPIERIYATNEGYIIQFLKDSRSLGTVGIPLEWFSGAAGKADIVRLPSATNWPSLSIFYVDGEFSHVRIYIHTNRNHRTWGTIPQGTDVSGFFGDRQTLYIEY